MGPGVSTPKNDSSKIEEVDATTLTIRAKAFTLDLEIKNSNRFSKQADICYEGIFL
jgi:hypothetical protein